MKCELFLRQPLQSASICITGTGRKQTSGCTGEYHHHTWHALSTQPEVPLVTFMCQKALIATAH